MIKVNLLGRGRSSTAGQTRRMSVAWIGLASLALAALGSGAVWWSVRSDVARVDRELGVIQADVARWRPVARDAAETRSRKTALTEQLSAIGQERQTRFAPVRILETVGQSLPADVWLTSLQQRGTRLEIDGRARSLEAITDFAGRIRDAGVVTTPVQVVSTSSETHDGSMFVKFSLRVD
jgi:Tfp pilus assembly protein PilN